MKRVFALILALVLVLSLAACGAAPMETTAPTTEPQISLEYFKLLAARNLLAIHDSRMILIDVATYMGSYWDALDRIGSAVGTQRMYEKVMANIEEDGISSEAEIRAQYEANGSLYEEVMFARIDSAEADAIKDEFEDFYNLYMEFYYMIMHPSGDSATFRENVISCSTEMNMIMDKLSILLD